jgi:MFS family permease
MDDVVLEEPGTSTFVSRNTPSPMQRLELASPGSSERRHEPVASGPTDSLQISTGRAISVILTLIGITFLNSMGTGILIAATPRMATDLSLPGQLILWPAASYAVAAGCLLLPFGAVADIAGAKEMWVVGSFLYLGFTVAIGRAETGIQLIVFRTLQGVSIAMCLPTTLSLISNTFSRGGWRTAAFSVNGMTQPLGFAMGLVLGGIFTDTIGWRWAFNMMALINAVISVASIWSLPAIHHPSEKTRRRRLREDIDWVGAAIMSSGLGLLLYVLAVTTSSYRRLADGQNIALLVTSVCLMGIFPLWMRRQESLGAPALIPNKIWRNSSFTSICISVFLAWASLTCMEYYFTL